MDQIREQMDISNEISDAISNPVNMGIDVDDVSNPDVKRERA
jgi:charged multivesicular body protein 4